MYFIEALGGSIVCEGADICMNCPPGQKLVVGSAIFGRNQGDAICPCQQMFNTSCMSTTAKAKSLCDGKSQCCLNANIIVFEDPCPGTYKYLEVDFACFSILP
ncbi:L-rhamnose-binding lectin CSL3-like [Dreissena polymorpha]|nr:L-rhamnose-binding lectin CSL3-like [Dreissena polymorpha]